MITRLPIAKQFLLLACFGIVLTVLAVGLGLWESWDVSFADKRTEIRYETEQGASIVRYFVGQERKGELTRQEAQRRAIEAVGAIRFAGVNYVAIGDYTGVSISNANKDIVGKNLIENVDKRGTPITRSLVDIARTGTPNYFQFYWTKIGETDPKLKIVLRGRRPGMELVRHDGRFRR